MNDKLLIVTDLGLFKSYRFTRTEADSPRLELLEELVLDEARQHVREKVADFAGRRAAPTNKNWGAPIADAHNLKLETKRRLVKRIAGEIERLALQHVDCGLWLAAHREINSQITSLLAGPVRERIEINLTADLVRAPKDEVLACVAPNLIPGKVKKPRPARRSTPSRL